MGVGGGLQHPNLAASGVRVEDVVERILALRAGEPVGPAASQALLSLDSRAVAALLKEVAKAGHVERAMELFDWLRGCAPGSELRGLCDVYTYTTDISLCSQQKDLRRALELVAELRGRGIQSNVHTFSALMNVCAKCGELELALDVFRQMKAEGCRPNVVTFNTLIDVYGKLGQWRKAVEVLDLVALEVSHYSRNRDATIVPASFYPRCLTLGFGGARGDLVGASKEICCAHHQLKRMWVFRGCNQRLGRTTPPS